VLIKGITPAPVLSLLLGSRVMQLELSSWWHSSLVDSAFNPHRSGEPEIVWLMILVGDKGSTRAIATKHKFIINQLTVFITE
jgi:hypothetical protein